MHLLWQATRHACELVRNAKTLEPTKGLTIVLFIEHSRASLNHVAASLLLLCKMDRRRRPTRASTGANASEFDSESNFLCRVTLGLLLLVPHTTKNTLLDEGDEYEHFMLM